MLTRSRPPLKIEIAVDGRLKMNAYSLLLSAALGALPVLCNAGHPDHPPQEAPVQAEAVTPPAGGDHHGGGDADATAVGATAAAATPPGAKAAGGDLAGSRATLGGLNVSPNAAGAQWLIGGRGDYERFRNLPPVQRWQFVHDRLERRLEELKEDDNPAVREVADNIHKEMDLFATEQLGPDWEDAEAMKNRPPADPKVYDTLLKTAFGMRVITSGAARIDELRERKDKDGARMSKEEFAALVDDAEKARQAMDRVMSDTNNLPLELHNRLMADENYKHNITKPLKVIGYEMGKNHIGWMQQTINSPGVNTGAAQYHAGNRDWAKAEDAANRALEQQPENPAALTVRAQARYEQANYAGALADGRAALRLDPSNENARGVVQFASNRLGPEMAAPKAANPFGDHGEGAHLGGAATTGPVPIEATPEARQSAALVNEAARLFKIGDYGAARSALDKAIDINPANADAHAKRAWLNAAEGRTADALASVKSALRLDPRRGPAMATKLAAELNRQGRYAEARDVLSLLRPEQRDANSWFQLARAHNGLGERDAMMASLKRAAELDPSSFAGRYQQAMSAGVDEDLSFLFGDAPAAGAGGRSGGKRGTARDRMLWTYLAVLAGGFLVALGLLHVAGGGLAQRVTTRLRSAFGPGGPEVAGPAAFEAEQGEETGPPTIAGNYELVRQIGLGGMGIVYECLDRSLGRKVAVKKMREEIRVDPRERERFISEARTVASLRHPNIVEIHSIVETGSDIYLVFEFVEGTTLYELLDRRGRLPMPEAWRIVEQAGEALAFAHKRDIIHRDLKPSNVMIAEGGAVKVMDFGVARQAKDAVSKLSMTNTIVGTPPYMAPEQEQGLVCKESDVYALAVCYYELVTGRLPFQGTGAGMLLNKMNKSYAPPSTLAPELPSALDELFAKAFEPDPVRRFHTVAEFLGALRGVRA